MANAYVGNVDVNPSSAYASTFGTLPDKTPYVDSRTKQDLRPKMKAAYNRGKAQQKALVSTEDGSGSTDYVLVPLYVSQTVTDISRKITPLVEMIPRVTNQGLTAEYNRITNKGSAFVAGEDAALNEKDDTYERKSVSIKYLYAVGRTTGQAQATIPSYMVAGMTSQGTGLGQGNPFTDVNVSNAQQLEVQMKTRALKELEEDLILNGSTSSDSNEFDGIVKQQSGTNKVDASSGALTYDHIQTAVRTAWDNGGRPKLAVCSSAVLQDISKLMIDQYRYTPDQLSQGTELAFGVSAQITLSTIVGNIPVIPSMYLNNTSGSKQIFFLDTDVIEMRVLQDMTYENLAKMNDSRKFFLKIYEALVMRAPEFNAYIDNIA